MARKGKSTEEIISALRVAEVRLGQGKTVGKICDRAGNDLAGSVHLSNAGDLMSSRNLFASILMACLLTVGLEGVASAGQSFLKPSESARNNAIEIKHRGRGPWPNLPIAPSYRAYDWPYYFSRGHYPTHIGPGYVYYGYPYSYRSNPRYGGRCSYWPAKSLRRAWMDARRCVKN